ncbi:MAG TPA: hypothetical protein VMU94_07900 [Streptosporangiaceae bacterium]|nr:hypothetical protein [Streptosporangiaceae bacterium]
MCRVLAEEQDAGAGVGAADADVVELAGVAEGDDSGAVDPRRGGEGCRRTLRRQATWLTPPATASGRTRLQYAG